MSAPILTIQLSDSGKAAIARAQEFPYKIPLAIKRGMDRALPAVSDKIQEERLTGKGPFPVSQHKLGIGQVSGGQLRQSVRFTPAVIEANTVTGSIGSPIRYGAVHEFGYSGTVTVRPFTRKNRRGDLFARFGPSNRRTKTQRKIASGISRVKEHKRTMNVPARAPFAHGLEDSQELIGREIDAELQKTFEAKP